MAIVAMSLPKMGGKKKVCGNGIVEIWGKKKTYGIVKSGMEFDNAIATIPFHFFFF